MANRRCRSVVLNPVQVSLAAFAGTHRARSTTSAPHITFDDDLTKTSKHGKHKAIVIGGREEVVCILIHDSNTQPEL
jgi:hypothetical protein